MVRGTLAAVEKVLRDAGEPLKVSEIVRRAGSKLPTKSQQPRNVVARDLAMDIKHNSASKFRQAGPGLFTLK